MSTAAVLRARFRGGRQPFVNMECGGPWIERRPSSHLVRDQHRADRARAALPQGNALRLIAGGMVPARWPSAARSWFCRCRQLAGLSRSFASLVQHGVKAFTGFAALINDAPAQLSRVSPWRPRSMRVLRPGGGAMRQLERSMPWK